MNKNDNISEPSLAVYNTQPPIRDQTVQRNLVFCRQRSTQHALKICLKRTNYSMKLKTFKDVKITYKSIPLTDLRFVSFSDASFANRANSQSQKGCLILAASKQIGEWQSSDVSPLIWYSRKIARVVGSTLASEAYALSGSVDLLSWLRIHWSWICNPSDQWKQPEQCLQKAPPAYAVVDCKSLYDLIQKTTIPQCQEYRTMLEALIIKDSTKGRNPHQMGSLSSPISRLLDQIHGWQQPSQLFYMLENASSTMWMKSFAKGPTKGPERCGKNKHLQSTQDQKMPIQSGFFHNCISFFKSKKLE